MSKQAGLGAAFYVGGSDLSGDINSLSKISGSCTVIDVTDITQSAVSRLRGLSDGGMDFTSYFDPTTAHPVLSALPSTDVVMSFWVPALAIGNPVAALNAKQINYDGTRGTDGSFTFAVSGQANSYGLEWGQALTAGLRTDTTATPGTALDNGAQTTFGAQAYLHVTAITGTSVDIIIEHSSDNSSYSTLIDFGSQAAAGASRVTVSNVTTVKRYLRASTSTGTFSSVTFAVMINRNLTAGVTF